MTNQGGSPVRGWIWVIIIVIGLAILFGWNPLGLESWEWDW